MKKRTFSLGKFILLWILIYIAVLVFGLLLSVGIIYSKNRNLHLIARDDMEYYEEHGEFNPQIVENSANGFVYDRDGRRVDAIQEPQLRDGFDMDQYAEWIRGKLRGREEYGTVLFVPRLNGHIFNVVALPMGDGGMYLLCKTLPGFFNMIEVMFFSVTLMVAISAVFVALHIQNNIETERMQREYVDNVSHELKSPIAAVRALTETMYDGLVRDEDKRKQYYEIMLSELSNLEKTVSEMLELSKIQNGQVDRQIRGGSAEEFFGETTEKYAAICENKGIRFRVSPPLGEYPLLYTDKAMISKILDILLSNAVKFTAQGGVICFSMQQQFRQVTVSVEDTGTGIKSADRPHIFTRFYKGDKAHNGSGSGLGLSIAREIADSLDEQVWLQKSSPEGTEFCFTVRKR